MAARPSTDAQVATSQELLRAAMRRSDLRNARVARRRLWLRWVLWGLGRALPYLGVAVLMLGGMALWADRSGAFPRLVAPSPEVQTQRHPASASAPHNRSSDAAPPSMPLRLDAESPHRRHLPQAQSSQPVAQE